MKKIYILIAIVIISLGVINFVFKKQSSPKGASRVAPSTYKVPRDKIVFNSDRDGKIDIWLMDRDGKGLIQLTKNQGNNLGPQWNGDKSKIIFVSDRDGGNYELYIMNADGANQQRFTFTVEEEIWPSISPDSRFALFARGPKAGKHDIWKLDLSTGKEINISNTPAADELESWFNPKMTKIIFTSDRKLSGVYNCFLMDPNGNNSVNLTNSPFTEDHCIFNSKGDKISFARADAENTEKDWNIWTMNADGSDQKNLSFNKELLEFSDCAPWSPDDDAIVFENSTDFENLGDLYLYEFHSGRLTNLTNSPNVLDLHPDW